MRRRKRTKFLNRLWFFALLCAMLNSTVVVIAADSKKPNVIIFYTDDQGTLDANCYGSHDLYTPTMDKLAATGVRFTQAYAHVVCCPSRGLLMTGRHPQRYGITNWTRGSRQSDEGNPTGTNLPADEITLAEALKADGYKTALFGKWHLGAKAGVGPVEQGFDRFYGHLGGFIDNYRHFFLHGRGFHDLYENNTEIFRRDDYFPDIVTDQAVKYLEENKESPFFMYVAFNIPHYPEQPDSKFDKRYESLKMPRKSYAKMVSTVDDRMGLILSKLEELKLRDNTVVIFMSDNGHSAENKRGIEVNDHASGFPKDHYYSAHGGGGNTGKWIGQKGSFLEGGIRVPAIISYPSELPQGAVRDQAISATDWFPTILDLCDVERPNVKLDGFSVLPLIASAATPSQHKVMHWGWSSGWAVREGTWKLIGIRDTPKQLVRLDEDLPERTNHLKTQPDVALRLLKLHNAWLTETTGK